MRGDLVAMAHKILEAAREGATSLELAETHGLHVYLMARSLVRKGPVGGIVDDLLMIRGADPGSPAFRRLVFWGLAHGAIRARFGEIDREDTDTLTAMLVELAGEDETNPSAHELEQRAAMIADRDKLEDSDRRSEDRVALALLAAQRAAGMNAPGGAA